MKKYAHAFSDEEIVAALNQVKAQGVDRRDACDRVRPANLCAFLNNLPQPERDRLLNLAYPQTPQPG